MLAGAHFGIAAWLGLRAPGVAFTVWPADPIPINLSDLEGVRSTSVFDFAAEFARMVCFLPLMSTYAQPYGSPTLWQAHFALLSKMDHAERPWTIAEEREFKSAWSKLYLTDLAGQAQATQSLEAYLELRAQYYELVDAGASATEIQWAEGNWIRNGHKLAIESALETVHRLFSRSSADIAALQRYELDPRRLRQSNVGSYAHVTYAPISAVLSSTWAEAEVGLDDLDGAMSGQGPRERWDSWKIGRRGFVKFKYSTLNLDRSWFEASIYDQDDWRLVPPSKVSTGDGRTGEMPGFVSHAFLITEPDFYFESRSDSPPHLPDYRPRPIRPISLLLGTGGVTADRPGFGASRAGSLRPVIPRSSATAKRVVSLLEPCGTITHVRPLDLEKLEFRTMYALQTLRAEDQGRSSLEAASVSGTGQTYVVGFGCSVLSDSPQPNSAYKWS